MSTQPPAEQPYWGYRRGTDTVIHFWRDASSACGLLAKGVTQQNRGPVCHACAEASRRHYNGVKG